VSGQDGLYLAELLRDKGYAVFGLVHGKPTRTATIKELVPEIQLIEGDLRDPDSLRRALELSAPDEVYNLAAISSVAFSFREPALVAEVTGLGVLRLLDAINSMGAAKAIRFYQASSSEMFGGGHESPQNEETPLRPTSPYAVAKTFGHNITVAYRESFDLFAASGILFNHESPRRTLDFVSRKITNAVARIKLGLQSELPIGNMDARRDWGYAGDYVPAMWTMLQQPTPSDYVIATGTSHSVGDFVRTAFEVVGISDWRAHVRVDPAFLRPVDVKEVVGDAGKARRELGWEPKVTFQELVAMLVEHDLNLLSSRRKGPTS
jgi:GDPmannose 4,6-dehydratase